MVTHLLCSLSFFCGFPKLMGFLRCLSRFWTLLPHCVFQHMCPDVLSFPWRLGGSVQRLDLRFSPFSALSVFFNTCARPVCSVLRPAGLFRAASVVVFCHCLLPWFFTPSASCPRSSFLILIFFFRSFFRSSFSFLLLPCFPSTRSHSLPTVVQRTQKHLFHVHTPPPPLYNGGTFAKSICVWRLDFVHETDSYTHLSDCLLCAQWLSDSETRSTSQACAAANLLWSRIFECMRPTV